MGGVQIFISFREGWWVNSVWSHWTRSCIEFSGWGLRHFSQKGMFGLYTGWCLGCLSNKSSACGLFTVSSQFLAICLGHLCWLQKCVLSFMNARILRHCFIILWGWSYLNFPYSACWLVSSLIWLRKEMDGERCICMRELTLAILLWMICHCASSCIILLVWAHWWRLPVVKHWKMNRAMTFDRLLILYTIMRRWHSTYCKSLMLPQKFSTFGSRCCNKLKKVEPAVILKGISLVGSQCYFTLLCLKLKGYTYVSYIFVFAGNTIKRFAVWAWHLCSLSLLISCQEKHWSVFSSLLLICLFPIRIK